MSKLPNYLARAELQRSDWRIMRAVEREFASPEWCEWRDELRRLVGMVDGFDELPPEPPFGKRAPSPPPVKTEPEPEAPLLPAPDALMSDWGPVGDEEAEEALTTDDLLAADDEAQTDVIGKLSRQRRKRFTELLNVELAELEQSRGGPKEDRKREAKIQRLLGVFARVGEM
jgi:hypothetical protein